MSATIEVVCYKSKVLANNESPLMLRITKDRKLKYSSIGISLDPAYWDFEKNKPRRHCPNRVHIEQIIAQIANLKQAGRTGYALSHQEAYNSLMKFNRHLDIYFSEVDTVWLKRFEA